VTLIINDLEILSPPKEYASFHGTSIFTTMRTCNKNILLWPRHAERLATHATYFGFKNPGCEYLKARILRILRTKTCEQKIRVILSDTNWALNFEDLELLDSNIYNGVDIYISSYQTHPQLRFFKTSNRLPYMLAAKEAQQQGAFEALLLDSHGFISDGSRTSLMLYDGQSLVALKGGLEGCMRQEVLEYAKSLGVNIKYAYKKAQELDGQLLLANSIIGVVPVGDIKYDFVSHIINYFRVL